MHSLGRISQVCRLGLSSGGNLFLMGRVQPETRIVTTNFSRVVFSQQSKFSSSATSSEIATTSTTEAAEPATTAVDNSQYPNAPIRKFFEETILPPKQDGTPQPIPTGRPWFASELRGKSFEDLHKLHFALLIERNKLLNEKVRHRKYNMIFPSPERLRNVRLSMARLQTVLTERAHESQAEKVARAIAEAEAGTGEVTPPELTEAQQKWFRAHEHLKKPMAHRASAPRASGGQKTKRKVLLAKEFETKTLEYIADLETAREKVVAAVEGSPVAAHQLPTTIERPRWRNLSVTAQIKLREKQTETRAQKLQRQHEQSVLNRDANGDKSAARSPKWTERPELAKLFLGRRPKGSDAQTRLSVKGRKAEAMRTAKN